MARTLPITVRGNRAVIRANPGANVVSVLDRWLTHGYIATIGELNGYYVLHKVIYDVEKVPMDKVYEIAKGIDEGSFQCPTCQKMAREQLEQEEELLGPTAAVVEPIEEVEMVHAVEPKREPERVVINAKPPRVYTVPTERAEPVALAADDYEPIDIEDAERHERERRVKVIVNQMDNILLLSSFG